MRRLPLRLPATLRPSGAAVAILVVCAWGCNRAPAGETRPAAGSASGAGAAAAELPARLPDGDYTPLDEPAFPLPANAAARLREGALARAQVWREPAIPIARADLLHNAGLLASMPAVACKFFPEKPSGTTPKFECVLPDGAIIKVKYGRNPEIPAEVAASRLLTSLGFGADDMSLVPTVRCFGCPASPYATLKMMDFAQALKLYQSTVDVTAYTDFHSVGVERRFAGAVIAHGDLKGWAWWELPKVDSSRGGAPRAHLDAFRLLAVFLAHWDNKAENQRLVCLDEGEPRGECRRPFAFAHDLGATFGPMKADLGGWRATPIWADPGACAVSMKALPHGGATFPDARISEEGRQFLADRLTKLTGAQIRDLFVGAQFVEHAPFYTSSSSRDVDAWVEVFKDKVRQIADRDPCPTVAPVGTSRKD